MPGLRAQGWQIEEMMKLFLVLIIGLLIALFIINISGGLGGLIDKFCASFPQWCGLEVSKEWEAQTAKISVEALATAVNCVADPENCRCIQGPCTFRPQASGAAASVEEGEVTVRCFQEPFKCVVTNFHLPQDFEELGVKPQEWIDGFGLPMFLVYWQSFPPGEDEAWASMTNWFKGAGTLIFAISCVHGSLKILRHPYENLMKPLYQTAESIGKNGRDVYNLITKYSSAERSIVLKEAMKSFLKDVGRESFDVFKRVSAVTGIGVGITELEDYYDMRLYNIIEMHRNRGNKLVLQQPVKSIDEFGIETKPSKPSDSLVNLGKPIILDKGKGKGNPTFYLASPCHADLTVENAEIICQSYSYDSTTNAVTCIPPSNGLGASNIGYCGGLFSRLESAEFVKREREIIRNLAENNILFIDSDNNDKWDRIRDPIDEITFVFADRSDMYCCKYPVIATDRSYEFELKTEQECRDIGGYLVNYSYCDEPVQYIDGFERSEGSETVYYRLVKGDTEEPVSNCGYKSSMEEFLHGLQPGIIESRDIVMCNLNYNDEIIGPEATGEKSLFWRFIDWYMGNDRIYTRIHIIGTIGEYGKIDKLYGIAIDKSNSNQFSLGEGVAERVLFIDTDNDGRINQISHFSFMESVDLRGSHMAYYEIFEDADGDGGIDRFYTGYADEQSAGCTVPAIKISVSKEKYNDKHEYNFCYQTKSKWWGVAETMGMFIVDGLVRRIPHPGAQLLATATDCGLAYLSAEYFEKSWPG